MGTMATSERDNKAEPVRAVTTPTGRPVWYPPEAILTLDEAADVLGVDTKTFKRYRIKCARLSSKTPRYLFRDVVAHLSRLAA